MLLSSSAVISVAIKVGRTAVQKKVFTIALHMMPTFERLPILDWAAEGGWCSRISCPPDTTDAMLEEIKKRGWPVTVAMWAHPETRTRQWKSWNLPAPDVDVEMERFTRILGDNFAWEVLTEDDSAGVAFPQRMLREQPKTYAAAKALFDAYIAEAMEVADKYRTVQRWGRSGYASGLHTLAALGLDCILVERANDDVEDLQTGVAFARGAARQFGCTWGIDFSLWWGVIYGCVHNLPTRFHKRNFYMTFFAGADTVSVEGGDLLYDLDKNKPQLLGETMAAFGQFARRVTRGDVEVRVAALLPEDHGWITPPYWQTAREAWNYARIPYQQGYRGVDAFFGMAYPGSHYAMDPFPFGRFESDDPPASPFALSCVTPEFAPHPDNVYEAEPTLPFGRYANRNQAREDLFERGVETSPYRPMGSTRWGDVIDVFTASVSGEVLGEYPLVVLLGPIRLTNPLKMRLEAYVKQGGTLLLAAGVAGPNDSDLCGVEIQPELWAGAAWRWEDESFVHESFRYCPARTEPDANVRVLAQVPNGNPVIACHFLGEGRVYTCMAPWFEGGAAMAGPAARMFDEVIKPLLPVRIEGLPVHWASSRSDDEYFIALSNCSDTEWKGRVCVPSGSIPTATCRELLTGESITMQHVGPHAACNVEVPPFDVRVLSLR